MEGDVAEMILVLTHMYTEPGPGLSLMFALGRIHWDGYW